MRSRRSVMVTFFVVFVLVAAALPALADGDQTLGAPSIGTAAGTGIAVGGIGLSDNPEVGGSITFDIPVGATVKQVLLYWEGQYTIIGGTSDDTARVDDTWDVLGMKIGTSYFWGDFNSDTYRADITLLKAWGPGTNSVTVSELDGFDHDTSGAGILAIYDDGGAAATIDVRDGNDGAFRGFTETLRNSTVPQVFTFPASTETRTADLAMFVSSAAHREQFRPNVVAVSGDVTQTFYNLFLDRDGDHWDSAMLHLTIPAGATTLTVEVQSKDGLGTEDLPSSLFWIGAGLMVPPPPSGCTLTQGYWKTHYTGKKYDSTWAAVGGPDADFFDTGGTWIEVFKTAPKKGNAFYILAHQYMAAVLNGYAGASAPTAVHDALIDAAALLDYWDTAGAAGPNLIPKSSADRATAIALAGILDDYNSGDIGPGHCSS